MLKNSFFTLMTALRHNSEIIENFRKLDFLAILLSVKNNVYVRIWSA